LLACFDEHNLVIIIDSFNAFFDCSTDDPERIQDTETVVGGYIASVHQWGQWEAEWRLTLADFEVPYFHMKEFIARKKAYSATKWESEDYRREFLSRLVDITKAWTIASFASVIKNSTYTMANNFFELEDHMNPYVICARDCAQRSQMFIRQHLNSEQPIMFVFERGDLGAGMLTELMIQTDLPSPVFKRPRPDPAKDIDDPPAIQLQASDLVAWEVRRGRKDWESKGELRKSAESLASVPHQEWKQCTGEVISALLSHQRIPLRSEWKQYSHFDHFGPFKNWESEGNVKNTKN
jgi:hypothetical protein